MQSNLKSKKQDSVLTHEGGIAKRISPIQELRRTVMACLLWEQSFYESGETVSQRIRDLCDKVSLKQISAIAIEARISMHLRHVPLLLVREMARRGKDSIISETLFKVIDRPDELSEFLAIYWREGRCPLSAQVKKGLARAFTKFSAYGLAKYNRGKAIKLRDVLFLCHAKPITKEQEKDWKNLIEGTLETPDTWEVNLSAGKDKKETFTRLLKENKLGALALLRNLRNMEESGVDRQLVRKKILTANYSKVLPFRFIAAARAVPIYEDVLEDVLFSLLDDYPLLEGKTAILVDNSGSMTDPLSSRSDMNRMDAAGGLALILKQLCEECSIISFGNVPVEVSPRKGFPLLEVIQRASTGGGTEIGKAVKFANEKGYDRIIVITDEQSKDNMVSPLEESKAYMINVGTYKNGVGYGIWTHIDGFSENVIRYILESEKER